MAHKESPAKRCQHHCAGLDGDREGPAIRVAAEEMNVIRGLGGNRLPPT